MLNLFTLKENNQINKSIETNNYTKISKHFPSPLREWKNSIYVYNKDSLNLIPSTTVSVNNIIKSYFNSYNRKLELKMRTKRLLLKNRRKSLNRFYISTGGFKHTNNKVLINLYIFNKPKINYLIILKKWYLKNFLKKITRRKRNRNKNINIKLIKKLKLINQKGLQAIKRLNKNRYLLIKSLNFVFKNNNKNKNKNKKINYNINTFKALSKYTKNFYKKLFRKSLRKIRIYYFYRQLLYINKSKLNYTYLQYLKKHLEKVYNKNVEFNIINVKRFYLNSDMLSEAMTIKISNNRKRINKYLKKLRNKVKIKKKNLFKNTLNKSLNIKQNLSQNKFLLINSVINNLKYKHLTGFRIEVKGRLNKRYTASRSIRKIKYKGNLLDINSSLRGLSSVMLKGNLKSNTQYTKLKSQTRVGAFGLKGWVSGN